MFKRIFTLMRQDWINTLRDNMLIYMMVGPILLTIGARFFVPSLNQNQYTFAVQAALDPTLVERLGQIGRLETYPTAEAVRQRVLRSDDMPGLLVQDGQPVLVFEGNEGEEADTLRGIFEQALTGEAVADFTRTTRGDSRALLTEYTAIIFIMIGSLLGALIMAFNIIEDKETRAVRALGVSPLSMLELTISRGLFALLVGLVIVLISTFILVGTQVSYPMLLAGFLMSVGLPILTGYVIGGFADSQLKAIAVLKFYMLVYLTLPIITIFIPRSWHVFFYLLPNYWMFQTFEKVFIGDLGGPGFWLSGFITFASCLALVLVFMPVLRRQLKLR